MPANTAPIYAIAPEAMWNTTNITAANTAKDGTGTVTTVLTAGTNGSYVTNIRIRPRGTNVGTVMRIFVNNGGANTTAANNSLIEEVTMAATTNSESAAINGVTIPMNIALPPGYTLFVTIGTTVAGGFSVTAFGGDY